MNEYTLADDEERSMERFVRIKSKWKMVGDVMVAANQTKYLSPIVEEMLRKHRPSLVEEIDANPDQLFAIRPCQWIPIGFVWAVLEKITNRFHLVLAGGDMIGDLLDVVKDGKEPGIFAYNDVSRMTSFDESDALVVLRHQEENQVCAFFRHGDRVRFTLIALPRHGTPILSKLMTLDESVDEVVKMVEKHGWRYTMLSQWNRFARLANKKK